MFPVAAFSIMLCIGKRQGVDNTAVVWPLLSTAPAFPLMSKLGVGRARTADPNQSKGYSIPQDICSAIKAKRKEEEGGAFIIYDVCLPEQLLCVLKLCFLGSGHTLPADGK